MVCVAGYFSMGLRVPDIPDCPHHRLEDSRKFILFQILNFDGDLPVFNRKVCDFVKAQTDDIPPGSQNRRGDLGEGSLYIGDRRGYTSTRSIPSQHGNENFEQISFCDNPDQGRIAQYGQATDLILYHDLGGYFDRRVFRNGNDLPSHHFLNSEFGQE
jgi:hypothetical protein